MALSFQRKAELARMSVPSEADTRERVRIFMQRTGMTQCEFADQVGYAKSSIGLFLQGRYDENHQKTENTLALRAAAKEYIDLHDLQADPGQQGHHHATSGYEEVRRAAFNALRRGTAYLVDGPPGTEKTWSLRQIEREAREKQLGRVVYVYARVGHSPLSFLQECCHAAGVPAKGNIDQLLRKLRFFLGKGRTLLMVDEAQHLGHPGLEVLRQLLDLPPHFGVLLAGSHDLTQRLSHWQMEQWRSRLRKTIYLNGPSDLEARKILRAELGAVSEADCTATIAQCMSSAARVSMKAGKAVQQTFEYISARDLFFAIERTQESLAALTQKKGAA